MEAGAQELREGISVTAHIFPRDAQGRREGVGKTAAQGQIEGKPMFLSSSPSAGRGKIEELLLPYKSQPV